MIIEYNDIKFDFDEVSDHYNDDVGTINAYIPIELWEKYADYCKNDQLFDKVFYDEFDTDSENEIPYSFYVNKLTSHYEVTSPDVYICFLHWLFYFSQVKNETIRVQYSCISWMFHDIFHAEKHVDDFSIMVDQYGEYDALHFGLKNGQKYTSYSYEFLDHIERLFSERFSRYYSSTANIELIDIYLEKE